MSETTIPKAKCFLFHKWTEWKDVEPYKTQIIVGFPFLRNAEAYCRARFCTQCDKRQDMNETPRARMHRKMADGMADLKALTAKDMQEQMEIYKQESELQKEIDVVVKTLPEETQWKLKELEQKLYFHKKRREYLQSRIRPDVPNPLIPCNLLIQQSTNYA